MSASEPSPEGPQPAETSAPPGPLSVATLFDRIVPDGDVAMFKRVLAAVNAELADKVTEFRAANIGVLAPEQRVTFDAFAFGYRQIAGVLRSEEEPAAA